jgi:hypothetical protein
MQWGKTLPWLSLVWLASEDGQHCAGRDTLEHGHGQVLCCDTFAPSSLTRMGPDVENTGQLRDREAALISPPEGVLQQ